MNATGSFGHEAQFSMATSTLKMPDSILLVLPDSKLQVSKRRSLDVNAPVFGST